MAEHDHSKLSTMDVKSHGMDSRYDHPGGVSIYIHGQRASSMPRDSTRSSEALFTGGSHRLARPVFTRSHSAYAAAPARSSTLFSDASSATLLADDSNTTMSGTDSQNQGGGGGGGGGSQDPDDWKNIADPKERRMAQNRIAQRKYRVKQRKELEEREAIAANKSAAGSQYQPPNAEDLGSSQRQLSGVPWGGVNMQDVIRAGQARTQQQQSQVSPGASSGSRGDGHMSKQGTYGGHGGG